MHFNTPRNIALEQYSKPITNIEDAKTFINNLCDNGHMFHFDDGAVDVWGEDDDECAQLLEDRVAEMYGLETDDEFAKGENIWGTHGCPIGYAIFRQACEELLNRLQFLKVDLSGPIVRGLDADFCVRALFFDDDKGYARADGTDFYLLDNEDDDETVSIVTRDNNKDPQVNVIFTVSCDFDGFVEFLKERRTLKKRSSLVLSFIDFAATEGRVAAIEQLEKLQSSLETIIEIGGGGERQRATDLMKSVNLAIQQITQTNAVDIAENEISN